MAGGDGRVVVGVDGSPDSLRALRWACTYAHALGLGIEVVVAWDVPSLHASVVPAPDLEAAATTVAEGAARHVHASHPDLPVTQRVVSGPPGKALVAASTDAALLVVGTRRELGSVSSYCSHYATCPVVIVRGDD